MGLEYLPTSIQNKIWQMVKVKIPVPWSIMGVPMDPMVLSMANLCVVSNVIGLSTSASLNA